MVGDTDHEMCEEPTGGRNMLYQRQKQSHHTALVLVRAALDAKMKVIVDWDPVSILKRLYNTCLPGPRLCDFLKMKIIISLLHYF